MPGAGRRHMSGGSTEKKGASPGEAIRVLRMAFAQYYGRYGFDAQSGETALLLDMLLQGCLRCVKTESPVMEDLPEKTLAEAKRMSEILRKRSYERLLRRVAYAFDGYDPYMTRDGALYYPDLKTYVYAGYLTPKTLLDLLAQPECEQVAVFGENMKRIRRADYLLFLHSQPGTD
jgi:hypothetical protein